MIICLEKWRRYQILLSLNWVARYINHHHPGRHPGDTRGYSVFTWRWCTTNKLWWLEELSSWCCAICFVCFCHCNNFIQHKVLNSEEKEDSWDDQYFPQLRTLYEIVSLLNTDYSKVLFSSISSQTTKPISYMKLIILNIFIALFFMQLPKIYGE